jgi:hypothetical protein
MNICLDDAGQEVKTGDLIYIVVSRYRTKDSQIGRIIHIEPSGRIHYISETALGGCRKNVNPTYFCRIETNPYTKPIEDKIDKFFDEWIKKHKDFK